jgi:NAD(P)H-hydrate epimerase
LEFPWDVVRDVVADASNIALYVERTLAAGWWRPRAIDAHKYNAGSVLVVGASAAMSGAVALACNAAYRAGAGLVEAIVPRAQAAAVDTLCVESLVHPVAEMASGGLSDAALAVFEARARPADAMLLGPGGGEDLESARVFLDLIDAAAMPLVVDADALRAFVRLEVEPSFTQPAVLTPHDGELVSLLGITRDELSAQRRELILGCARRWNAIILHKGAPTMVAAPDGSLAVIGAGGPGLATAGSGDVLAGAVAALLAAGMPPLEAACLAAYLHGRAGDRLEEERGVAGLMARDLVDELARVVAEVEGDLR